MTKKEIRQYFDNNMLHCNNSLERSLCSVIMKRDLIREYPRLKSFIEKL